MKVTLDPKLTKRLKSLQVGILVVEGLDMDKNKDDTYQFQCTIVDQLRKSTAEKRSEAAFFEPSIVEWKKSFKKLGIDAEGRKPSHISLYDRIIAKSDMPNLSPLVNLTNAISLKYLTPIGAHDMDTINGDVTIGQVETDMEFPVKEEIVDPLVVGEEFAYMDEENIITRHYVWKQSWKTYVKDDSENIFIPIDTLDMEEEEVVEIIKELAAVIGHYIPAKSFKYGVLNSHNSVVEISKMEDLKVEHDLKIKNYEIKKDKVIIDRILNKAVEEVLPSREKLEKLLLSGRRLKIYQGFDPTADTLHIGHTVSMRKLEDFRKLGHEVIMLIGDFTARIGDPTDKSSARVSLTEEQVSTNFKLYKKQASSILNFDDPENPVKIMYNNDWLGNLQFPQLVEIASEFTVQQMVKREMFQRRLTEKKPIFLHEFLYPMMQGWDSVAMNIDVEIGGNDQLFNMLSGRLLVDRFLGKDKIVITGKLLESADGSKMGKSEGNMIALSDSARDMFGSVMAFDDHLIVPGFELLTDAGMDEVNDFNARLEKGENPMGLKKELAFRLTSEHKGIEKANDAQKYFEEVFQTRSYDTDIEVISVEEKPIQLLQFLSDRANLSMSKSALRRMIEQGAVTLDSVKMEEWDSSIVPKQDMIVKVGKNVRKVNIA